MLLANSHPATANSIVVGPFAADAAAAHPIAHMVEVAPDGTPILDQTGQIGMAQ
jgi:hypothetical protein